LLVEPAAGAAVDLLEADLGPAEAGKKRSKLPRHGAQSALLGQQRMRNLAGS
jgi:hypothetical protein